jgi:tRNA pseudouridine55 synthase
VKLQQPLKCKIKKLKPPVFSAIKVDGKKAYTRARADEDFDLPERESSVYSFDILAYDYPRLVYSCKVSKGTYIRSLSQWIAEYLGSVGYTSELRRTSIGNINLEKAVQLEDISADSLSVSLVSVLDILPSLESITLKDEELQLLRNGNSFANSGADREQVLFFDGSKECRGIAYRKENRLYPKVNL